ncbi:hypothetical protein LPJ61_006991, partial [Coemansia biformis]
VFFYTVAMSCGGCSNAVIKALANAEFRNVKADLTKQRVTVTVDEELEGEELETKRKDIFKIIEKTGKKASIPDAQKLAEMKEEHEAEEAKQDA